MSEKRCKHCQEPIIFVANRPLDGNGHWEHGTQDEYPAGCYVHCKKSVAEPKIELNVFPGPPEMERDLRVARRVVRHTV